MEEGFALYPGEVMEASMMPRELIRLMLYGTAFGIPLWSYGVTMGALWLKFAYGGWSQNKKEIPHHDDEGDPDRLS